MPEKYLTPEHLIDLLQLNHDGCSEEVARERLRNRCRPRQIPFIRLGEAQRTPTRASHWMLRQQRLGRYRGRRCYEVTGIHKL